MKQLAGHDLEDLLQVGTSAKQLKNNTSLTVTVHHSVFGRPPP